MKTIIDICDIVCFNKCSYCRIELLHKWCYTWDICTGRLMEILAYNMVLEGEYYG